MATRTPAFARARAITLPSTPLPPVMTAVQNQPMKESKWVVVMFLATRPDSRAQEDLQKTYVGPEELCIIGQEVYIYYPNGIGRSKLTNTFLEKKLKTAGTGRNWNTILQLQKLIQR